VAKRIGISKKTRFEVFKRDAFACQYCGESAPDVILNIDHIHPVAEGGTNEMINLVTSCFDCNSGKGKRTLADDSVVKKQIDQLKLLSERKEQLELMAKWRTQMVDIEEQKTDSIANAINKEMEPANRVVTDSYRKDIRAMLKKYSMEDIWEAIDKSSNQYLKDPHDAAQRDKYLSYIPRICYWTKIQREDPVENEICKILGIASKCWYRLNRPELYRMIKRYHSAGWDLGLIRANVAAATGINAFMNLMDEDAE
jgi:hypothetical protein